MIRIEKKGNKYYVNGKEVTDELELPFKVRLALRNFKESEKKLKIKSTVKDVMED